MIPSFLRQCSLRIQKKWRLLEVNVLPCAECGLEPFGSNVYSTKSDIYFLTQQRLKMIKNWRSNWSHGHAHATYVWLYVESPFCCEQNSFVSIVVERRVVSRLGVYWFTLVKSDQEAQSRQKRSPIWFDATVAQFAQRWLHLTTRWNEMKYGGGMNEIW